MNPFPKKRKKVRSPIRRALDEVARERRERGFRNEDRLLAAVSGATGSGESAPPWFGGFRRASVKDDLRRATDFFLTAKVWIESEHQVREFSFPINAKSSRCGVTHLRSSRSSAGRTRHKIVPIVGFVVDPHANDGALRQKLWDDFSSDQLLRNWLTGRGWQLATQGQLESDRSRPAKKEKKLAAKNERAAKAPAEAAASPQTPEASGTADVSTQTKTPTPAAKDAKSLKRALEEARGEANGIAVDISVADAERVIGSIFGRRFSELRKKCPELEKDEHAVRRFIEAAQRAFFGWRSRAARSIIEAA